MMRVGVVMKRFYTNRDLIGDRYGRWFHLPKRLVERGCEVVVFCPDFRNHESIDCVIEGIRYRSVPAYASGMMAPSAPWLDYRADIWIASGQLFAAKQVSKIALKQGKPWLFDCYDFYPTFFPRMLRPFARNYFARLLKGSDGALVASRNLELWASEYAPIVKRIPNGVDLDVFKAMGRSEARLRSGIGECGRLLGYFGSLREELGLEEVLVASQFLKEQGVEHTLLTAGECSEPERITRAGGIWLGMLTQEELALRISSCDCVLVPYRNSLQVSYSNSCRLTEFLAMGVPIVATKTGDHSELLNKDFRGWAAPSDASSLAGAISRQLLEPSIVDFPGKLEWRRIGDELFEFLVELANPKSCL